MPKISIIIPVYNSSKYISKCIESILNQTEADFEVLLIDDGSLDGIKTMVAIYVLPFKKNNWWKTS